MDISSNSIVPARSRPTTSVTFSIHEVVVAYNR